MKDDTSTFRIVFGLGLIIGGQPSILDSKDALFDEFKKKYSGDFNYQDNEVRQIIEGLFEEL